MEPLLVRSAIVIDRGGGPHRGRPGPPGHDREPRSRHPFVLRAGWDPSTPARFQDGRAEGHLERAGHLSQPRVRDRHLCRLSPRRPVPGRRVSQPAGRPRRLHLPGVLHPPEPDGVQLGRRPAAGPQLLSAPHTRGGGPLGGPVAARPQGEWGVLGVPGPGGLAAAAHADPAERGLSDCGMGQGGRRHVAGGLGGHLCPADRLHPPPAHSRRGHPVAAALQRPHLRHRGHRAGPGPSGVEPSPAAEGPAPRGGVPPGARLRLPGRVLQLRHVRALPGLHPARDHGRLARGRPRPPGPPEGTERHPGRRR